jgi:hypothetical protein
VLCNDVRQCFNWLMDLRVIVLNLFSEALNRRQRHLLVRTSRITTLSM